MTSRPMRRYKTSRRQLIVSCCTHCHRHEVVHEIRVMFCCTSSVILSGATLVMCVVCVHVCVVLSQRQINDELVQDDNQQQDLGIITIEIIIRISVTFSTRLYVHDMLCENWPLLLVLSLFT